MEQSDFLTAAAQIAVGLAGFTGVAVLCRAVPQKFPLRSRLSDSER
jgi:hypothetical protein